MSHVRAMPDVAPLSEAMAVRAMLNRLARFYQIAEVVIVVVVACMALLIMNATENVKNANFIIAAIVTNGPLLMLLAGLVIGTFIGAVRRDCIPIPVRRLLELVSERVYENTANIFIFRVSIEMAYTRLMQHEIDLVAKASADGKFPSLSFSELFDAHGITELTCDIQARSVALKLAKALIRGSPIPADLWVNE